MRGRTSFVLSSPFKQQTIIFTDLWNHTVYLFYEIVRKDLVVETNILMLNE